MTCGTGWLAFRRIYGFSVPMVSGTHPSSFAQRAEAIGLRYTAGPGLEAINISNGQPITIATYRSAGPS